MCSLLFFFFNDTATTEIYPLSLHDALPISSGATSMPKPAATCRRRARASSLAYTAGMFAKPNSRRCMPETTHRSEEHTSELQSQSNLACRLLLEKKKKIFRRTSLTHTCSQD